MVAALLLCSAILGQAADSSRVPSPDLKAYQDARAAAGRTAEGQVQLALWCEAHGLTAERLKHLTRAILLDPANATARGLLGQVSYKNRWMRPDEVQSAIEADPGAQATMREYLQRRARTSENADAHQQLAQWCDEHGLADQALAHYQAALRIDPKKEAVWKKLGYKKSNGRWARPEDIAAEKVEGEAQKHADKYWKLILEKARDGLASRDTAQRRDAEAAFAAITDPRAVPMIWAVLVRDNDQLQLRAAETLGQVDGPSASEALVALAVYSSFPATRGLAAELLNRRDPRDFMATLLSLIHEPFRYQVQPLQGAGSEGGVFVEGERYNVLRWITLLPMDESRLPPRLFSRDIPFLAGFNPGLTAFANSGPWGAGLSVLPSHPIQIPGVPTPTAGSQAVGVQNSASNLAAFQYMTAVQRDFQIAAFFARQQELNLQAEQRIQQEVQTIESLNQRIREVNERALPLAKSVSGQDYGTSQDSWLEWWNDQLGYAYKSPTPRVKPTYKEFTIVHSVLTTLTSCFAAGTPVQTISGPKPVESVQIGDRVLSQNATTGAISYQPVLAVQHNEPAPLLKLSLGTETILATGIHRFWKVGKGWTMARDLKPGDVVRSLGGTASLTATEPAGTAPVFNLDVAENRDFFVGERGFLVYDFSVVEPVARPFDAPAVAALDDPAR